MTAAIASEHFTDATHDKVVVPEPLRGHVDRGDVAALAALGDVDFAQPYDEYRTPSLAHRALARDDTVLLTYMLERGGDALARKRGLHGATLSHVAARRGNVAALRLLLRLTPDALYAEDSLGWLPLHDAAMEGREAAAEYLVRRGANPTWKTKDGQTAEALALTSDYAGAKSVSAYLERVRAAGGIGSLLWSARFPFVQLRWLAERDRARPVFVLHPKDVAFAAFLFDGEACREDPDGDEATIDETTTVDDRRGIPFGLLVLVLRFLF